MAYHNVANDVQKKVKTCLENLLESFGMDAILVSSYEYIVRD